MLSQKPERKQGDKKGPQYTKDTALVSDPTSYTRQEAKADADINVIVRTFGLQAHNRPPIFTTTDYDMDLQGAIATVREARNAYRSLPPDIRRLYPTIEHLVAATERGEITIKTEEPPPEPPPTT